MNRRLQQFLAAENISQSQFADTIGVARASVSHILAGRNKPGFDFIENMSKNYPNLNLEWLITGKGKMYKGMTENSTSRQVPQDDLFADYQEEENFSSPTPVQTPAPAPFIQETRTEEAPTRQPKIKSNASLNVVKQINNQRSIAKIIVFYDDNTYQELK